MCITVHGWIFNFRFWIGTKKYRARERHRESKKTRNSYSGLSCSQQWTPVFETGRATTLGAESVLFSYRLHAIFTYELAPEFSASAVLDGLNFYDHLKKVWELIAIAVYASGSVDGNFGRLFWFFWQKIDSFRGR